MLPDVVARCITVTAAPTPRAAGSRAPSADADAVPVGEDVPVLKVRSASPPDVVPIPVAGDGVGGADPAELVSPRLVTALVAGVATFVLALAMLVVPPPYAVHSPGPTWDTLSEVEGAPMIRVEGAETYPTDGELRLTTVYTIGGPGVPATAGDVLRGWLSPVRAVLPREAVYAPDVTREEVRERSQDQMTSSQTNATVAALTELGYEVPAVLHVATVPDDGASSGVVEPGDVLEWIAPVTGERTEITSFEALSEVLGGTAPGSPVRLGVLRDGQDVELEVVTGDDGEGGSLLGVLISPDVDLPVDVEIAIERVGGPSAGLVFALGIVDVLTPGALTGGEAIAGTGTMSLDGNVGPIGGIVQKLAGASRDGADWFLAPVDNCASVVGNVPDGLHVVAVDSLAQAREAVEAIADGNGEELLGCS